MRRARALQRRSLRAYAQENLSQALTWAKEACALAPNWGPAWWALALTHERQDDSDAAHDAFTRAAKAKHEPVASPYQLDWEDFTACISQAQADLPESIATAAQACNLILDDYTPASFLSASEDENCYELMGLFSGHPLPDQSCEGHGDTAATIHIWRRPHQHCCASRAECLAEVRNTYYHELGHYFGYDEDGIARMGLA